MNICPYCDRNNPEAKVICDYCGRRFSLLDAGIPTLVKREESLSFPEPSVIPGERSSQFPEDAVVVFRVEGSKVPLMLQVCSMAVLGRASTDRRSNPHLDLGAFDARNHGVSARHAALHRDNGQLVLRDLGSTNGTYLNGKRLAPYQTEVVCDGDELHLGKLCMHIHFERHQAQRTS